MMTAASQETRGARHRACFVALSLLAGSFITGCYSANRYTTARTVPRGEKEIFVAPEYFNVTKDAPAGTSAPVSALPTTGISTPTGDRSSAGPPRQLEQVTRGALPTFGARFGVGDAFDLGLSLHQFGLLHADLKWQMVGGAVDLAFLQGFNLTSHYAGMESTLLLGARLGEFVQLVGSTGVAVNTGGKDYHYAIPDGLLLRLGGGIRFQVPTTGFALQPEVTRLWAVEAPNARLLTLGLGFSYGW
jgi:hypothetical protein